MRIMKGRRFWGGLAGLCMLLSLLGGMPVTAETTEEDLFRSYPSSAMFNSLWVGDIVVFASFYYDDDSGPAPGNTMTVLSGSGVEVVEVYLGVGEYCKGLKFTKPGKASVRVKATDPDTGASAEKTFSFTVSQRPVDKPVTITYNNSFGEVKMKIGERLADTDWKSFWTEITDMPSELEKRFSVKFHNVNYGLDNTYGDDYGYIDTNFENFCSLEGGLGGASGGLVGDDRIAGPQLYAYYGMEDLGISYACKPGKLSVDISYAKKKMGELGSIIIEEPVITADAPASVKVGSVLNLTTALTNTSLKNLKVSEYEERNSYGQYCGGENPVAYMPSVSILEGQDCVTQSDQDYSNTLTSSETLTFKKAGTVKLKVTYAQIAVYGQYDKEQFEKIAYNPEKIITIQVTDGSGTTAPATGGSTTGTAPAANPPSSAGSSAGGSTTGGSAGVSQSPAPGESSPAADPSAAGTGSAPAPSLPPVEERPVVLTDGETGIQIGAEEGVLPPDTALVVKPADFVLTDAAGQFTAFDISLENGGARIQPDGRVQVSIPIPAGYDRERLAVYHIAEDGTRTELPSAVVGEAITFETAHFSLYVVAEKAAAQAAGDTSLPGGEPAEKGGSPVIWIILCVVLVAAAGGGFALWYVKFRKKTE